MGLVVVWLAGLDEPDGRSAPQTGAGRQGDAVSLQGAPSQAQMAYHSSPACWSGSRTTVTPARCTRVQCGKGQAQSILAPFQCFSSFGEG